MKTIFINKFCQQQLEKLIEKNPENEESGY